MTEKVKKPYKSTKPVKHKEEPAATLTDEITAVLEEIKEEPVKEKKKGEIVTLIDDVHVTIGAREYLLVKNHREAFDAERLGERFSDVLSRYDYIVGDWGYDQLRLKGFFNESNRKAAPEQRIDTLEDYLYEYCNFGCAYFVIERVGGKREKQQTRRKKPNKKPVNQTQAHTEEKRVPVTNKTKPVIKNRKENEPKKAVIGKKENDTNKGRSFTIRQREE
ncbi:YutD family protein [Enterococcus ureasiticus]|uniref:Transcriptional regulator n=1 Tax=Enterococcus ureasiticus TaxID=903984 RepID=A0A1E5GDL0_9ENTE|nr:YutD family protein [Enterococcus ureasiticus]OEG10782.1 transcriptional regulator [Enterococcus ureasiticus]